MTHNRVKGDLPWVSSGVCGVPQNTRNSATLSPPLATVEKLRVEEDRGAGGKFPVYGTYRRERWPNIWGRCLQTVHKRARAARTMGAVAGSGTGE